MVGGLFQKPLHPLVTYGYCLFEDVVYVDPSGAPDRRPTYAIVTFLELFVGPCVDRSKVMDEGPDYATTTFFRVLCWDYVHPCDGAF